MPRGGSRPGAGRPLGTLSPSTLDAIAREAHLPPPPGPGTPSPVLYPPKVTPQVRRAKEYLEWLMVQAIALAAYYKPDQPVRGQQLTGGDIELYQRWSNIAASYCQRLMPYQDPTFRAILVTTAGEPAGTSPPNEPSVIDGAVDEEDGSERATYLRLVQS